MHCRVERISQYRVLLAVLVASWLSVPRLGAVDSTVPNNRAIIRLGDTTDDIRAKLGEPLSSLGTSTRTFLNYPEGQILLENGHATQIPPALQVPLPGAALSPVIPASIPTVQTPALVKVNNPTPLATPVKAEPDGVHPPDVHIIEKAENGGFTLIAESDFDLDYTITLQLDMTNAVASHPLPYTVDSDGRKSFELIHVQQKDPTQPWKYSSTFHYSRGGQRVAQTNDAVYLLPYSPTETHRIDQGNFGSFSHFAGSQSEYAVDFHADPGTIICAARDGVVTGVRQDYTAGGTDEKYKSQGNYIIIKHDDGTHAEYFHIQHNGALVELGQRVTAGQNIALSGATGYASGPHIHFAVFQNIDGNSRITLPVKFKTPEGILTTLKQGERY